MIPLARKPSLWAGFFGRLAFGVIWAGSMFGATWLIWTRDKNTPVFAWVLIGILDLFAVGIVWDLVVRFWRTLNGRQPVVEMSRDSLRYGESAQLRVAEPHPQSVKEMVVRLIAEEWITRKDPDGSSVSTVKNFWDEELLRANLADGTEFSRMLQVRLPGTAPSEKPRWKIVVTTELRQGGIIEHAFPFSVT